MPTRDRTLTSHPQGYQGQHGSTVTMNEPTTPFGRELREQREALRFSQSKLAEHAGFDHSYVSRLESGARTPTRDAVDRLAEALGAGDAAKDRLLAAAGFLPDDATSLVPEGLRRFVTFYEKAGEQGQAELRVALDMAQDAVQYRLARRAVYDERHD